MASSKGRGPAADMSMMESILQLYGLAMVVLPVYAFVSLRRKIRDDGLSKPTALLRYIGIVVLPIIAYAGLFGLAVGIEAVTPLNLVAEEVARSFVLAVVLGLLVLLLGMAVFAVGLLYVQAAQRPNPRRD